MSLICVLCLKSLIECVDSLQVDQSTTFPSDHAPVSAHFTLNPPPPVSEGLFRMATSLCNHSPVHVKKRCLTQRPIRIGRIDSESFVQYMQDHPPGPVTDPCDSAQLVTDIMYDLRATNTAAVRPVPRSEGEGWQRILDEKDDKALWTAIHWKGEYQVAPGGIPTDEEFKAHMETLLYPADSSPLELTPNVLCPYVPVLDDLFQVEEVKEVLTSQVRPNKSAGPDGVSPGVFRLLPTQWIIHLTVLGVHRPASQAMGICQVKYIVCFSRKVLHYAVIIIGA